MDGLAGSSDAALIVLNPKRLVQKLPDGVVAACKRLRVAKGPKRLPRLVPALASCSR